MWWGRLLAVLVSLTCLLTVGWILVQVFQAIDSWRPY